MKCRVLTVLVLILFSILLSSSRAISGTEVGECHGSAELSKQQIEGFRAQARKLVWSFPTSSGNPVAGDKYKEMVDHRADFAKAALMYLEQGDSDAAIEISANAWRLWMKARDFQGGLTFLNKILDGASVEPTVNRALALYGAGLLAYKQGEAEESKRGYDSALSVAEKVKDPHALTLAYTGLSRAALLEEDADNGRIRAIKAREYALGLEEAMDQAPLHLLAQSTRLGGNYDAAAALFDKSIALNRKIGDQFMVEVELHNLGWVEIHREHFEEARTYFKECAPRADGSDDPYGKAITQMNRAALAFGEKHLVEARSLLNTARETFKANGLKPDIDELRELNWLARQIQE